MAKVKQIYCGKEENFNDYKREIYKTSYRKKPIKNGEILEVDKFGFLNDTQSEKEHHGGIDKAVCIYSQKYYSFFKEKYDFNLPECAFGENFTILDLDDSEICLGDQFKCGEVVFEVSQPRRPCWKISSILNIPNLTAIVAKESKTGFYFRVIKPGKLKARDDLILISRKYPKLTIEFINDSIYNARDNADNIIEILKSPKLADAFRISLKKRLENRSFGLEEFQLD
ncbi:MOSC domain-containing protein [Campylobacter blaseri]|nr:MOSC domain-containing protein [Campylobacter blaseri]